MHEPWSHRRKRLEDLVAATALPGVTVVPVTEDAAHLWDVWVGQGGEGVVLKAPESRYYPGMRSPAWLKLKAKLSLEVTVTGGDPTPIAWGDWGIAVNLALAYPHPRTGKAIAIAQAVRIRRDEPFALRVGATAEVLCWASCRAACCGTRSWWDGGRESRLCCHPVAGGACDEVPPPAGFALDGRGFILADRFGVVTGTQLWID